MSEKPWDGRFAERTDTSVEAFTASIQTDKRLYPYDIEGSVAHCRMLATVGVITTMKPARCPRACGPSSASWTRAKFQFDDSLEDIHMHIEARLLQTIGQSRPEAAHRPQPQRPGRPGCAHVPARGDRAHRSGAGRRCAGCWTRPGRAAHRCDHAGLHPLAAGPTGAAGPSLDGLLRNVHP
jgi:hypothetical protein